MNNIRILGIDEAGRGCVLGPLCMAGVITQNNNERAKLLEMGCKDSKTFGSSKDARLKRAELAKFIKSAFQYKIEIIDPVIIDDYVRNKSLNLLEQEYALKIIAQFEFDKAVLDGENLFKPITSKNIIAANKADHDYVEVAAASILAKDRRDEELSNLFKKLGFPMDLPGGGYVNPKTMTLMLDYYQSHGKLPEGYRHSYNWKKLAESLASLD